MGPSGPSSQAVSSAWEAKATGGWTAPGVVIWATAKMGFVFMCNILLQMLRLYNSGSPRTEPMDEETIRAHEVVEGQVQVAPNQKRQLSRLDVTQGLDGLVQLGLLHVTAAARISASLATTGPMLAPGIQG